jgi:hypothetical protein
VPDGPAAVGCVRRGAGVCAVLTRGDGLVTAERNVADGAAAPVVEGEQPADGELLPAAAEVPAAAA